MAEPSTLVIALTLKSLGELLSGLFGGGPAGSGGVFREAYRTALTELSPLAGAFQQSASQAAQHFDSNGFSVVADLVVPLDRFLQGVDGGFEQFKGSNLLGQTMYSERLNSSVFRLFTIPLFTFTVAWVQTIRNVLTSRLGQAEAQVSAVRSQLGQQAERLSQIGQGVEQVGQQIGTLARQTLEIDRAQNQGIEDLQDHVQGLLPLRQLPTQVALQGQEIASQGQKLHGEVQPLLRSQGNRLGVLESQVEREIRPSLTSLVKEISAFPSTIFTAVIARCQELLACLDDARKKDVQSVCEQGRSYWGTWAECWLEANTPGAPPPEAAVVRTESSQAAGQELSAALAQQPTGPLAAVLGEIPAYMQIVLTQPLDTLPPFAVPLHDPISFIYQAPGGA